MDAKQFNLTSAQYDEFANVAKSLGIDISVLSRRADEAKPDISKKNAKKVISVSRSVLNKVEKFVQLGMSAKTWYADINKKILTALGDSDGTLFLILLAIFSANTALKANIRNAAQAYMKIKEDLADPQKNELLHRLMNEPNPTAALRQSHKENSAYQTLATAEVFKHTMNVAGIMGNLSRILKLYFKNGYKFSSQDVVRELSQHYNPERKGITKNTVVGSHKIFNFTLNLLNPKYQHETGWIPVTIDTWMITFFYPYMDKKEKQSAMSSIKNYAYLADVTTRLAKKFGMKPYEMQAVLWVATLKSKKGVGYNTDFNSAVDSNLADLAIEQKELKQLDGDFSKIIQLIGSINKKEKAPVKAHNVK